MILILSSTFCVPQELVCDKRNDCPNGADELHCNGLLEKRYDWSFFCLKFEQQQFIYLNIYIFIINLAMVSAKSCNERWAYGTQGVFQKIQNHRRATLMTFASS